MAGNKDAYKLKGTKLTMREVANIAGQLRDAESVHAGKDILLDKDKDLQKGDLDVIATYANASNRAFQGHRTSEEIAIMAASAWQKNKDVSPVEIRRRGIQNLLKRGKLEIHERSGKVIKEPNPVNMLPTGGKRAPNKLTYVRNSKGEKVYTKNLISAVRAGRNVDARIKVLTDANISKSQATQLYRALGGDMKHFYSKAKDAWYAKREVTYLIMQQAQK